MQTLPHAAAAAPDQRAQGPQFPALATAMDRPAQQRAIAAWHQGSALGLLEVAISHHQHFPLIACSERPRAYAPRRGAPTPAGVA